MSGGSFNYLCHKFADDLLGGNGLADLQHMADALARLGYAKDAAAETRGLLADIRVARNRADVAVQRLGDLWKAFEWWQSDDWSEDRFKEALVAYRNLSPSEHLDAVQERVDKAAADMQRNLDVCVRNLVRDELRSLLDG